eukprot:9020357-Pyramimonas_sp.AAC.1
MFKGHIWTVPRSELRAFALFLEETSGPVVLRWGRPGCLRGRNSDVWFRARCTLDARGPGSIDVAWT